MTRRKTNTELALACCRLGYAAESLMFLVKVLWFISDRDALLPSSVINRFAVVVSTLREISETAPNERVDKRTRQFLEAVTRAKADLEVRWRSDERYNLLSFLDDVDEECIPENWSQTNSPLSQQCWTSALNARTSLANALPPKLCLCLQTGELVARVERLIRDVEDETTIGKFYPIHSLEHTLPKLCGHFPCLNGLDTSLSSACGDAGTDLENTQRRVREIYDEVIRRFEKPQQQIRMSAEEANVATGIYLRKHPNATQREIAKAIGSSHGLVGGTPAWKVVQEQRRANHPPKTKRATHLSDVVLDRVGIRDEELKRLFNEQKLDYEPSPLETGDPSTVHKRV